MSTFGIQRRCQDVVIAKMTLLIAILTIFFGQTFKLNVFVEGQQSSFADVNISALLNSFQEGYDKRVRPNYGGEPVTVGVTMYVLSISSVSEVMMDFTLDMYFRQFWQDPRLSFEGQKGLKKLVVGAQYIEKIWVPDTFFVNEKTAYFHKATTENQFLRILNTGEILRSIRLTITASCPMDLQYFPMDRQLCYIEIESFGYTMSDIRYKWNDGLNSVQISADVSLPQFKVLGHRQKTIEASLSTGNYSRLACEIQFVRSMGYYLIQIYIPSSLIVIISWVSFWLNRGATPARVGLGVTTVLTMTTLMASTNAALPKISYVKSIDVYLGACFFMVFASLLEYASVGYMAKRIQMRKNRFLQRWRMCEVTRNGMLASAFVERKKPPEHLPNLCSERRVVFAKQTLDSGYAPKKIPEPYQGALLVAPCYMEIRLNMHDMNKSNFSAAASSSVRLNKSGIPLSSTSGSLHHPMSPLSTSQQHVLHHHVGAQSPQRMYHNHQHQSQPAPHPQSYHSLGRSSEQREEYVGHHNRSQSVNNSPYLPHPSTSSQPSRHHPHSENYRNHEDRGGGGYARPGQSGQPHFVPQMPPNGNALANATHQQLECKKNLQKMMGISPSDIDKYSRIFFPISFISFNLMYWIIYLHVSDEIAEDLVMLHPDE
ncbi:gamma-aminobutyric acid receptor subunit beta-like [Tigriopus californicus]|uniref:gamma-aminobutyric acid receptor subunit beta-like n=1 Tax=Tigriopus californicus TaxID=6832 RepID=UPI0027DA7897|nr:gamma-aminobutyric acid receptor subunit beta-like [Tigriopus californicus]